MSVLAVTSCVAVTSAAAQHNVEVRPVAGAFLPTGSQRDVLKDAAMLGGQVGWRFNENFALTGTFGWAPSRDRTTDVRSSPLFTGREERVDVFDYALGVEVGLPIIVSPSWSVTPYLGAGGGGRSFAYRDVDRVGTETAPIGYGALGVDLGPTRGRLGLRIEARDNVSGFKGLRGENPERKARNDVQIGGGVVVRF